MSNFIPMVSSSPPPLEDGGGGFNDWDDADDEFGTFATATVGNDFQAFSDQSSAHDQWNNIPDEPPNCDFEKFADFSAFASDSKTNCLQNGDMIPETENNNILNNDSRTEGNTENSIKSGCMKLPLKSADDKVNNENVQESPIVSCDDQHITMHKSRSSNLDSVSSVISAGDSGLCSTDISPLPQSDENVGLEDKTQGSDLDDFGDFHSDSSVGKEVLKGSMENMDRLENQEDNVEIPNTKNNDGKCKDSFHSDSQVSNDKISESINENEISELDKDSISDSVPEQSVHEQVSPGESIDQHISQSTSSTDTSTYHHSEACPDGGDGTEQSESNKTINDDHGAYVRGTGESPDTKDVDRVGSDKGDVSDACLEDSPRHTPSVQDNCMVVVSNEVTENGHNEFDSESSDSITTDSSSKAESHLKPEENQDSTEIDLKHSDSSALEKADDEQSETFHKVEDNEESTEQSQEMKDSGFVFTDLSSSEEDSSEKKEETLEAKLEENCDISIKQTVDNNEKVNVISKEDLCKDSVSSESKDVQATDFTKPESLCEQGSEPEPPSGQGSDDEFDDFADFNSAPQFSVPDQCVTKSDDSGTDQSPTTLGESKSDDKHVNKDGDDDDDDEFDDFADFHSSKPTDNSVSESFPQTTSSNNEIASLDFNSGNCSNDNDVDDDFDSFADFSSHFTSESSKNNSGTSTVLTDEAKPGSDGFNAFPSASAADGDNEDEDDWATFQAPPTPDQVGAGSNEDDFGDFEDFEHAVPPKGYSDSGSGGFAAFKQPEPAVTKPMVKQTSSEVITSCFPEFVGTDHDTATKTPLLLDDCCPNEVTQDDKSKTGPQIWVKLKSPNSTIQLSKLWSESHSNSKLFTTLRIDTRNILLGHRKPSVPMYAANLTLLEPTKGPTPPSETKSDANKLVDTSKVEDKPASQDLPPVQFDWSNSGLTNPLEANSKSLELDFLVVKEAEAVAKMGDEWDWVFDSELMHGQRDSKSAMQPLENILANLKTNSTMRQVRPAENLTPEATKVISSLPNLSFMKARALMFPFKQSSDIA
ncbi:aftiphilin-like isoform X3 [Argopecten irradians]|uniref:aftiphilin-like isoform X3 n=1 Tax=Argopecten irradians TaxID=31199 RepID=UPI003719AE97